MNKKKLIKWIFLLSWMTIIFLFSAEPNSGTVTHGIIERIIPSLKGKEIVETINFVIRKSAHIMEYLILTYLIYSLLKEYKYKERNRILLSILFCFLYSITDEIHQIYVPGRSGVFKDCLIDTIGGCLFILLKKLSTKYRKSNNNR